MGLRVFNPRTKTFAAYATPSDGDMSTEAMLLFNILLELNTITQLLAMENPAVDTPEIIRSSLVSDV